MSKSLLDFSTPHVLRDEAEYDAAITEIERLLDEEVEPASEGYDRLEFLSVLVEYYEDEQYPMDPVSPMDAASFLREQGRRGQADLDLEDDKISG